MKLKVRDLFRRALEEGFRYGITRAFKHLDQDALTADEWREERRVDEMVDHLMSALDEIVADWDDIEPYN